ALAMQRKVLPSESPELVTTLAAFAPFLLNFRGKVVEAESMLREALRIQTNVAGTKHPVTASILVTLSRVLSNKGDYAGAESFGQQAVAPPWRSTACLP